MLGATKAGLSNSHIFIVTEESGPVAPDTWIGYEDALRTPSLGSIYPATLYGVTIGACYYNDDSGGVDAFVIRLNGNRAQSFFTSATTQYGETFLTASADTYSFASPWTTWAWDNGGSGVTIPSQWDGSGTVYTLII